MQNVVYGCPVGVQLVDEFHRVRNPTDQAVKLAKQHKHMRPDNFDFWSITGTPMPTRIGDLKTTVDLVQRADWDDPDNPNHNSRVCDLEQLEKAHIRAVSVLGTPADVADFLDRAESFFGSGLVMRHTERCRFFGRRIFNLQDAKPGRIAHFTPDKFLPEVQAIADRVRDDIAISTSEHWEQAVRSLPAYNKMRELEFL